MATVKKEKAKKPAEVKKTSAQAIVYDDPDISFEVLSGEKYEDPAPSHNPVKAALNKFYDELIERGQIPPHGERPRCLG